MDRTVPPDPGRDCPLCPRLVAYRDENRTAEPGWFNAPVPSFGATDGRLLIVGLAPGRKGANRTGRPFTGDFAGDLLYPTLLRFGFARGAYGQRPDDGLELVDARLTNAVRCVPPQNKPERSEIATCNRFLIGEIAAMPRLRAIVALGRIAHDSVLRALGRKLSSAPFGHAARHNLSEAINGRSVALHDSYHCSRYNTNTGVLSEAMFCEVFAAIRKELDAE
jgi:uracil-DNA glycosylase family 4